MLLCDMCNDSQWLTRRKGSRVHVACMGSLLVPHDGTPFIEVVPCLREFHLFPGVAFISTVTDPGFLDEKFAKPQRRD